MTDQPILLRDKEVAAILRESCQTLANKRSKGIGIPFIRMGRNIRYLQSDVLAYLAAHRVEPKQDQELNR